MRRTARASCSRRDPLFLVLQSQFWFVILPEASSGERALCGTGSGRRPRASRIPFRSSHLGTRHLISRTRTPLRGHEQNSGGHPAPQRLPEAPAGSSQTAREPPFERYEPWAKGCLWAYAEPAGGPPDVQDFRQEYTSCVPYRRFPGQESSGGSRDEGVKQRLGKTSYDLASCPHKNTL